MHTEERLREDKEKRWPSESHGVRFRGHQP